MPVRIELLGAGHQRAGFDCGEPALNEFLQRQSGQLARKSFGKTYVALAADGLKVIGYVTLSVGQIETPKLPPNLKLPRYPAPVMRIGRLAVDLSSQGQTIGQHLMSFALQLSVEFSAKVGLYAVVVDAKNDTVKAFYTALGFRDTLDDALSLYLPIALLQNMVNKRY